MVADLTKAEQRLIEAAAAGEVADYSTGEAEQDDPAEGASWGEDRTLSAEVVRKLCLKLKPDWPIDPRGVRIHGAKIAGDLDFGSATIDVPLEIVRCHIPGEVILHDATTKRLRFSGSWLRNGLAADGLTVGGDVFLDDGFSAMGEVRLLGADIGGDLACVNGTFEHPDGNALSADRITVKGSVFLRDGFSAKGAVRLPGADIAGNLECDDGAFESPGGNALFADGITVKGSMFLRAGFSAKGEVRLLGANIGGVLDCVHGTFENPDGNALIADRITVKGSVFLSDGFSVKGQVRFPGADIGGNLDCHSARFETNEPSPGSDGSVVFSLEAARVAGVLLWRDLEILGKVTLAHAKVGGLADEQNSWPDRGALDLNGFEYDEFAYDAPTSAAAREDWLARQEPFRVQPYEQVIRVLRRMGHDRDARDIAIAKQVALRDRGQMSAMRKRWNRFLEVTVAYGYKPWRALLIGIGFWIVGAGAFDLGHSFGLMSPADSRVFLQPAFIESAGAWLPPDYPRFNAFIYSLDVFLPIVDLHQESRWLPNMLSNWGWALWVYMWFQILAGWLLTSVFVAALTGLIKKD